MRKMYLIFITCLLAPFTASAASNPEMIVVCYPGGSVNAKDANGAMSSMLRVVERVGQWKENSFNSLFTAKTDECRKQMAQKNPKFAITSLGLYLELHTQHNLVPVVQPKIKGRTNERYRVMAQKDKYKNLDELKGLTLGGTVLEESSFIGKIVFAGKYDPASFFVLKPSNQAIRAFHVRGNPADGGGGQQCHYDWGRTCPLRQGPGGDVYRHRGQKTMRAVRVGILRHRGHGCVRAHDQTVG
jgi:hypothetical protein